MLSSPKKAIFSPRYAHFNFLLALCSRQIWLAKNWCDSHMHFSAGTWNFRPTNIPMEFPLRSPKRLHAWKCIPINSPTSILAILFGSASNSVHQNVCKFSQQKNCGKPKRGKREKRGVLRKGLYRTEDCIKKNLTFLIFLEEIFKGNISTTPPHFV